MYETLKEWCVTPFNILPFLGADSDANPTYDNPVDAMCYPEHKVTRINNRQGVEVISSTKLYIDGTVDINVDCNLIFNGVRYIIHAVADFYEGATRSIRVVYI